VSKKLNESVTGQQSRRSFLVKAGLGASILAVMASPLARFGGRRPAEAAQGEFPGPDSIFHPASDPRQDPRSQSR